MKKFLPYLLLCLLASCAQPPPPGFSALGPEASQRETAPAPAPAVTAPIPQTPAKAAAAAPAPMHALPETNAAPASPAAESLPPTAPATTNVAAPATAAAAGTTDSPAASAAPEEVLPAGTINFPATDLNQVLQIYSELVNRTILRPTTLPAPTITLKTQTPLTKKEAIQAFDAVLAMNGITMINVGDKFVKAVPTPQANQEAAAFNRQSATQLPELGQYVTHVLQLKYVKPSELAPVLQQFAKVPNSILPIDSSQILVLRDYTENVKRMLEMIKEIDIAVPSEYVSEVIPIKYAKAADIADALNSVSSGGGGATSVGRSTTGPGRSAFTSGFNRPGTMGGGYGGMGGGYGGYAPGGVTPQAAQIQPAGGQAPGATSFTERLRNIIKTASGPGELQIIGQTKIIADERTNSLLIFATRPDMDMIKNIVSKLDVVLAQVLIETIIMDVSLSDTLTLGLSAVQTPRNFTGDFTGAGGMNAKEFFSFSGTSGDTNAFNQLLGTGLRYFGLIDQNYYVQLQAAAAAGRANVLQNPRILTSHATPGSIFIGSTVPYITSTYYGGGYGGGPSSQYQQLQVGIGLTVTPYINPDGLVVMQIDESIDEIAASSTSIQGVGEVPNTVNRRLSAEIAVRDGDSVILGGFIRNATTKQTAGVPLLKDLPVLGMLFSSKADTKERKELLVLMRPTVLKTPDIAAHATLEEKKRLPGIMNAEAESIEQEKKELEREQKKIYSRGTPLTPEEQKLYGPPPASADSP